MTANTPAPVAVISQPPVVSATPAATAVAVAKNPVVPKANTPSNRPAPPAPVPKDESPATWFPGYAYDAADDTIRFRRPANIAAASCDPKTGSAPEVFLGICATMKVGQAAQNLKTFSIGERIEPGAYVCVAKWIGNFAGISGTFTKQPENPA